MFNRRIRKSLLLVVLICTITNPWTQTADAMDRDVRSVLITSSYGALAGTAVGLLTFPLSRSVKGIFTGSSLGLYLGIAVGLYHVTHRYDPENPMRMEREQAPPWVPRTENQIEKPAIDLRIAVLEF